MFLLSMSLSKFTPKLNILPLTTITLFKANHEVKSSTKAPTW